MCQVLWPLTDEQKNEVKKTKVERENEFEKREEKPPRKKEKSLIGT
jgi:hypothetical protein